MILIIINIVLQSIALVLTIILYKTECRPPPPTEGKYTLALRKHYNGNKE